MRSKKNPYYSFVLAEEFFVFIDLIKWFSIASLIGGLVGSVVSLFLKILDVSIQQSHQIPYIFLALPLIFLLNHWITKNFSPDAKGHGTEKVIKAVHQLQGALRFRVAPIKFLITILTLSFGGSAGKEGPSGQIGAAMSSSLAGLFKMTKEDRKKMVICGVSAGFAAVFGTPIAGAIFGVEVLFVGRLLYGLLLPSMIAGLVSYQVCQLMGVHSEFVFAITVPSFSSLLILKIIFGAFLFGLGAVIFIEVMRFFHKISKKYEKRAFEKIIYGGMLLSCFLFLFQDLNLAGLGTESIRATLLGSQMDFKAPFLKIVTTALTLNFGGSGGILTPILYVGSGFGSVLATFLKLDVAFFATLGMVSFLAGMANTPIAAMLLAIELFGTDITPYAALCCIMCYIISGSRSVFPAQIMIEQKSEVSSGKMGDNVAEQHPHLQFKTLKTISKSKKIIKKLSHKVQFHSFF